MKELDFKLRAENIRWTVKNTPPTKTNISLLKEKLKSLGRIKNPTPERTKREGNKKERISERKKNFCIL